ncbi:hypothetical protein V1511DRAFT_492043 [Dipodascopsis uninucleata]
MVISLWRKWCETVLLHSSRLFTENRRYYRQTTKTRGRMSVEKNSKFLDIKNHFIESPYYNIKYVDTHCHVRTTLDMALSKGCENSLDISNEIQLSNALFSSETEAIVDVYCDIPVSNAWKTLSLEEEWHNRLDSTSKVWSGRYYFTIGCHPHSAKFYTEKAESQILEALQSPKCVAVGECGLDYKKSQSPHDVQRKVFERQIEIASKVVNKPLVVHTREAEDDTLKILRARLPKDHPMHVHCFTDSEAMGRAILREFPNSVIGITGVITFASLKTTTELLRSEGRSILSRIVLETDSPFMIPNNIQKKKKPVYAISHSGMIPFTAQKVAELIGSGTTAEEVLQETRQNAYRIYGI